MRIDPAASRPLLPAAYQAPSPPPPAADGGEQETRRAFQSFVGQTLFGQMLKEMRKSVHKSAYFHGGRAEEIFQQQLDQVLAEKMSNASAERLSEPMYRLFTLGRR